MAQIPDMNPNSTQFPTKPWKLHPIKFPFPPSYIKVSFLHFFLLHFDEGEGGEN